MLDLLLATTVQILSTVALTLFGLIILFIGYLYIRYRFLCKQFEFYKIGRCQFIPPILCQFIPNPILDLLMGSDIGRRFGENMSPSVFSRFMHESGDYKMYKVVLGIVSNGTLVVGDSTLLKDIATKKITSKLAELELNVVELFGGSNIFVERDYELWHRQRKLLDPAFAPGSLKIVEEVTVEMINKYLLPAIDKNPLMRNIEKDFSSLTLQVIGLAGFNYDFKSFNKSGSGSGSEDDSGNLTVQTQKLFGLLPIYSIFPKFIRKYIGLFPHRPAQMISQQFTNSIREIINERTKQQQQQNEAASDSSNSSSSEHDHNDILSLLLKARREATEDGSNGNGGMTDEEIVSNCFIFLVAGHETTARTLGFILYSLATDSDAQDRLHKFLDHDYPTLYGKETFDFNDYQEGRMDYLRAVFKESLRLFPVASFAARVLTKPYKWKDIVIPKGTQIAASWLDIHMDEKYWPQPNEFIPERFLKKKESNGNSVGGSSNGDGDGSVVRSVTREEFKSSTIPLTLFNPHIEIHQNPFAFSGFGIGNRICQGRYFAEIEACFCLALLAKRYKFSLDPSLKNYKLELDTHVTLRPRENLLINFERRDNSRESYQVRVM